MSVTDEELMEKVLAEQIPEAPEETTPQAEVTVEEAAPVEKHLNQKQQNILVQN